MSLVEIIVVIAILVGLAAVLLPALNSMFMLEQRRAAKELTLTYETLHDQAMMRNVTFRVAYHLDGNFYQVEVGSPDALIFEDPESRERWEREQADRMRLMVQREREAFEQEAEFDFQQLQDEFFRRVELPPGTVFGGVYTPQYGEMMEPSGDPEEPRVVYSYIFPNGYSEHAVVHLVSESNPLDGFTIEVEPVSGRVHLAPELRRYDERFSFVPREGPELPQ